MVRRTGALALALALAGTAWPDRAQAGTADPLRVMSFNVRFDNGGIDSVFAEDGWLSRCGPRRDRLQIAIDAYDPDVLGVQEALANQVDDLTSAMAAYGFYGVGRNDGVDAGEFAGLFFRASRFALVDSGTFWLSETPDVPGTVFPGSGAIRIASWVVLDDLAADERYFVLNTHWDHVSQSSRQQSAALIRERLALLAGGLPVIVMGDLNVTETNSAFRELVGQNDPTGLQLVDGYRVLDPVQQPDEATFHAFDGGTAGSRIDFVLNSDELTPVDAAIDRTGFTCGFPSDHYAVWVTLAVPGGATVADATGTAGADPCVPGCEGGCASVAAQPASAPVAPSPAMLLVLGGVAVGAATATSRRRARRPDPVRRS